MELSVFVLPAVLQIAAVAVVIAEIIIPSGGLLSVAALVLCGYSLFHVFQHVSYQAGIALFALDLLLLPACIIVGIKLLAVSPVTLRTTLSRAGGVTAQDESLVSFVGETGEAITTLRPAGLARLRGCRMDVVTSGDFLPRGCTVEVVEVTGNRIVVREKQT